MGITTRAWLAAIVLCAACRDDSCLDGTCALPCASVNFAGATECLIRVDRPLFVGRVADAAPEMLLQRGHASAHDIVMTNGIVTAVISDVTAPNDLAPTGGNLIDFGPYGGLDDVTLVYQIAGILPDDAFAYTSAKLDHRGGSVAVTLRGTLDGRPDVAVVTHYEMAACDFGVRVRSELFNGSAHTQAFFVADGLHWGKRRVVPFVPAKGQGYLQPELDLLELSALWTPYDYAAGANPSNDSPAYAAFACDYEQLSGVNDTEISALGTPMTYVGPGDTLVLERMLLADGEGTGAAPAVDRALVAREQLHGDKTITARGRVVAGSLGFGGDVRRASIVLSADGVPVTSAVPASDGTFAASVPADAQITAEVWSFGRSVATVTGAGELGDITIPEPARVQIEVTRDNVSDWAIAIFVPDDAITQASVEGTWHGRLDNCAPWLGPPNGASPACNQAIIAPQGTEIEVPAGNYAIYATAGPEHTLAVAHVQLVAGEVTDVDLNLRSLAIAPDGWLSADFHVHGRASFDSGFPDDDRVRTFVASGIDVIAATDHDVIGDYWRTVVALDLDDRVAVMGGLEATQLIPWMDVPGEDLPRVIGHMNFWPLIQEPSLPRAGAPSDEGIEPGELFDRMAPLVGERGMMMLNHPWDETQFGRDLGYLRAIKYDPRRPIDEGTNALLLRRPGGGLRNVDWNIMEIINGSGAGQLMAARTLWFSLLAQGYITPGAGNSDSHGMTDGQLGWARNWVQTTANVGSFRSAQLHEAVHDGRMIASNGIFIDVEVGQGSTFRGLGFTPYAAKPGDVLRVRVRAAPWIPVDEVRVVTSRGTRVVAAGALLTHPADPFGFVGLLRYQADIPLSELVDRDDFLVVEAGLAYPLAADIDDDGVLDTTDNNGDGRVDAGDVEEDEDIGPLAMPADPIDPADPRYLITRVTPRGYPEAFANPLFIDVDGGGWTPPGVQ